MGSIIINSVKDLIHYLNFNLDSLKPTYRYRGQSNSEWSLKPSIYRYQNLKRYQTTFFEEILLQNKPFFEIPPILNTNSDFEWLMLCQHYDIETRFLDWTSDYFTALYFACNDNFNDDGALFICDITDYQTIPSLNYEPRNIQELVFFYSNLNNPRMRAQSGSFMIWGHSPLNPESSTESYDLWEYYSTKKNTTFFLEKLIIPKNKKKEILEALNRDYSINKETIYLTNHTNKIVSNTLKKIKQDVLNTTLYITEVDRLSFLEKYVIKYRLPHLGENCFGNCVNIKSLKINFRLL